jgi:hypothetical protein
MSSVIVIAPVLIASWPTLSAAIVGAMGSLGFALVKGREASLPISITGNARVDVDVADSEILQDGLGTGDELVVEREGVTIKFNRDARGTLRLCVEGPLAKSQLRAIGEELMGRVVQQFAYNKIMSELETRNLPVLSEEVMPDRSVKIRVRAW